MRHRMRSRKLGRTSAHRSALYRNMVTSLLDHERIQTTDAKAKEVRRVAERMITLGKRASLHARRRALRVIRRKEIAAKLFDELAERYRERAGGYTRVVKLGNRRGDAAPISIVELVEEGVAGKRKKKAKKTAGRKAGAEKASAGKKEGEKKKERGGEKAGSKRAEKTASKKSASKKSASKKTAPKKTAAKKTAAKKAATGKGAKKSG